MFDKGVSSKEETGHGLGLHLVKQLLNDLSGDISFESVLKKELDASPFKIRPVWQRYRVSIKPLNQDALTMDEDKQTMRTYRTIVKRSASLLLKMIQIAAIQQRFIARIPGLKWWESHIT